MTDGATQEGQRRNRTRIENDTACDSAVTDTGMHRTAQERPQGHGVAAGSGAAVLISSTQMSLRFLLLAGAALPGTLGCATAEVQGAGDGGTADASLAIDAGPTVDAKPVDAAIQCPAANTCESAMNLGSLSGDVGADEITANGDQPAWYTVRVTENYEDVGGRRLSLRATLTSPPGANYDLYLYVNDNVDQVECAGPDASSTLGADQVDTATVSWGEGTLANGADDGRTVTVEVRHTSGPCSSGQTWSLDLRGNP